MQTIEMNKKAVELLEQWDPFEVGQKAYELEIADVVAELHYLDHPTDLAKRIREIYEHSYELWIPIENCVQIAYKLLAIKYEAKCIV
ncbi:DUF1871 family protein [Sporosarcina sp. HYO08]|uniref:DUF1871 family protein n=1 Tax=Sporosarcina sp. HYO08 TaxID=1759557 RepID=UPI000796AB1C|nr:DUF1871 family protein [Sporosarcina sp. HYO08]KXH79216.1 hypothetical protein AU377_11530 [Sporosarcina sp. HYO08]